LSTVIKQSYSSTNYYGTNHFSDARIPFVSLFLVNPVLRWETIWIRSRKKNPKTMKPATTVKKPARHPFRRAASSTAMLESQRPMSQFFARQRTEVR
jgi:hypothetical protein